jgi:hypothetical protein
MTLRGNVIMQKANPNNNSQVIAIYNDAKLPNLTMNVHACYNTFIGNGGNAALVHVSNADGTTMNAEISDNIISGTGRPFLVEDTATGTVTGMNNWLASNATVGPLSGSVQSASPGFRNVNEQDYRLATNSVCIGAASASSYGLPGREYWLNEVTNRQWRIRNAARDIGAFESTSTGEAVGPYSPEPRPRIGITPSGANVTIAWPLFARDFRLEQSDLDTLTDWSNAPFLPETNATGFAVSLIPSATGMGFRLRK